MEMNLCLALDTIWKLNNRKIFILFFFFFLLLSSISWAEVKGHGVEVRLVTPKLVESEPGKIITASFFVSNKSGREEEFFEKLILPSAWQEIIPPVPFRLKAEGGQVRIVAFLVPANCPAGSYKISYAVRSQRDYGITDMDTLTVVILPVVKFEILIEEKPEYVIAGKSYKVGLRLVNMGNSRITIKLAVKGTPDYPIKGVPPEITLEVGQSHLISLEVKTDEKLDKMISHILKIEAKAEGPKGIVSSEETISVKVIPRMTGKFDPYHRLHSQISFIGASENGKKGFQMEFSGLGSLDEKGERGVEFLFRGPDIQDKCIFGERDEYRLNYYGKLLGLHLGDQSFSLSPLTEQYRYGRGVGVAIHPAKIGFWAFYLKSRWEEPEEKEAGTYLKYQINEMFGIKGNFLYKRRDSDSFKGRKDRIYSLEAQIRPGKVVDMGLEYGLSDSDGEKKFSGHAYQLRLKGELFKQAARYTFEKTHAGPRYFGYYTDADYTSGTVTFPIYHKLHGNFSYRNYKDNLELDPAKGEIATREQSYRTGISYTFSSGASVSLDYEDFQREDRLLPAEFDFREKGWHLWLGQTFRRFGLQGYVERWKLEDRVLNTSDNLERYSIYGHFYPTDRQTYTFYTMIGNDRYTGSTHRTKNAGVSTTWRIKGNFNAGINYQKNNFDSEMQQDTLLYLITYTLPNAHSLSLRGRWIKYRYGKGEESSLLLTYTIPLGIPVSKKQSIGTLKGRVRDWERLGRPPIPNVILTADGASAVTNQEGEFLFPSLKPGTYHLSLEKDSIGLNRVTIQKLPIVVEVKGGKTTQIDIGVVTSCRISGRIAVFTLEQREIGGWGGILVELMMGREVLRRLTDEKGRFSFEDLRPGKWTLKVYDYNLPPHHYLEKDEFQVEIRPGGKEEITIRVLPRRRPIKIIEEEEIKQETK